MTAPTLRAAGTTGKELIFKTLRHQETSAIPWVPFAGVHVGILKGYSAREVLTNGDRLVESILEANRLYAPDGQPVVFDLQIEAEILGCDLMWAEDSPPSVANHPLQSTLDVPNRLPEASDGRLPLILDAMRRVKAEIGQHTALYGLVTGPFTLASHLRGTDIFMDMVDQPEYVMALLAYTARVAQRMTDLYLQAGMDVIAVVDPVISQISPRHFKKFMATPFGDLFAYIRSKDAFSAFFVCGDATKNVEGMCLTAPDCIAVDENIDMATAKQITDRYNICLEGNIPLTSRMLLGTQQDNMQYVIQMLDQLDHHNLIVSPGCDMPYATPVENVIGAAEAIRDPERTRLIIANYQAADVDLSEVELPDYAHLTRPLMEVFTLDSASCAACSYMMAAATRAADTLAGQIDMVEYKITKPENIARLMKMGIREFAFHRYQRRAEIQLADSTAGRTAGSAASRKGENRVKLHLVGGFLGSGKTTAILAAAKQHLAAGQKVGIITNDQGRYLVDSAFFRLEELPAVEVTGGCFCCHYDDLDARLDELIAQIHPDVIFAESVGSCADLVSTVIRPLLQLRPGGDPPASFSVFADARLLRLRLLEESLPFSDEVVYIFDKQIEEAGLLVVNKVDLLKPAALAELQELVAAAFQQKTVLYQNSLAENGTQSWLETIQQGLPLPRTSLEIDYQRYGAGEARMAWLDEEVELPACRGSEDILRVIKSLLQAIRSAGAGIGHLKFVIQCGISHRKLSLPSLEEPGWQAGLSGLPAGPARLLINARLEMDASGLRELVETALVASGLEWRSTRVDAFRPGQPNPTHSSTV